MKKVWWLILLVILPTVNAALLSDWPMFFVKDKKFSAKYVVGEEAPALDVVSATVISTSLARFENVTTEVGTSTLDTEIADITKYDAIVVGSPCENRAAYQLMGSPEPCYKDLGGSIGYIKLYENGGKVQILITGLDEKDRSAAAKYLAQKDMTAIKTREYLVPSNSGSVPAFFEQRFKALNVTKNVTPENATVVASPTPVPVNENITVAPSPKPSPGPYEPIREMPKKKGFWARLWGWLSGLFT